MKNKKMKIWRVNLFVTVDSPIIEIMYKQNIIDCLRLLANVHAIDFAISDDSPRTLLENSDFEFLGKGSYRLLYFRSTETTRIDSKDFRKIVIDMFDKSIPLVSGHVDFCFQYYNQLSRFPFPC